MTITVTISSVHGESSVEISTTSARLARLFLEDQDHEGSGLSATFELDGSDPGDVYAVLQLLEERRRK
jgi:hypothetical protein